MHEILLIPLPIQILLMIPNQINHTGEQSLQEGGSQHLLLLRLLMLVDLRTCRWSRDWDPYDSIRTYDACNGGALRVDN